MSDERGEGAWFRRRTWGLGYNFVPISWHGWVTTLALAPVVLATVFAADPSMAKPSSVPFFLRMKAMLGLSGAHLPVQVMLPLILGEAGVFVLIVLRTSRTLKPLD